MPVAPVTNIRYDLVINDCEVGCLSKELVSSGRFKVIPSIPDICHFFYTSKIFGE